MDTGPILEKSPLSLSAPCCLARGRLSCCSYIEVFLGQIVVDVIDAKFGTSRFTGFGGVASPRGGSTVAYIEEMPVRRVWPLYFFTPSSRGCACPAELTIVFESVMDPLAVVACQSELLFHSGHCSVYSFSVCIGTYESRLRGASSLKDCLAQRLGAVSRKFQTKATSLGRGPKHRAQVKVELRMAASRSRG